MSDDMIKLEEYRPPCFEIEKTDLVFELDENATRVFNTMSVKRLVKNQPLQLVGEDLVLKSVSLDDVVLEPHDYDLDDHGLIIHTLPDIAKITVETEINPKANTYLEGLYFSKNLFCTQCEAHGFRRISYYLDRPDVMSVFSTTLKADKSRFPVLLSNGNKTASGDLADGRHWVSWHDPFKKPCYLFACVAGNLQAIHEQFTTQSGRIIDLSIYVEPGFEDQCDFAMTSLKQAMRWDEAYYGREYDLDNFMIVAVRDFNMGAMENKGLNIFNAKYILARPDTATDTDYQNIESVVAHEYFHNWTGNRITCRDWFQLSLKEGLTVFRDQEFSRDMNSRAVNRIQDVILLKNHQFPEDAGPMAHPVQPKAYREVNNFYTATVYNKGAEVVRMIHTILGAKAFRAGMDKYFDTFDGQAVCIEDFVSCFDLPVQFLQWYCQTGTPRVSVSWNYDTSAKQLELSFSQMPTTPVLMIPIRLALLNKTQASVHSEQVFILSQAEQTHRINASPDDTPSLLRDFSAPVLLDANWTQQQAALIACNDNDGYSAWYACQTLAQQDLLARIQGKTPCDNFINTLSKVLTGDKHEPALKALFLQLPTEATLAPQLDTLDAEAIHCAREAVFSAIANRHKQYLLKAYQALLENPVTKGERDLLQAYLSLLMRTQDDKIAALALSQCKTATSMSLQIGALEALCVQPNAYREPALEAFYQQWHQHDVVMDKWFNVQARIPERDTLTRIQTLCAHPSFDRHNPNKVRALLGGFANANPVCFRQDNGAAITFITEQIEVMDVINPQVSVALLKAYMQWRRYPKTVGQQMLQSLEYLSALKNLSSNCRELIENALKS